MVERCGIVVGHEHLVAHGAQEFIINLRLFVGGFLPDAELVIFAEGILSLKSLDSFLVATNGN